MLALQTMLNHKPSMEVKHTSPGDRVYEACWQDGSIDLFAGVAAAGIGVAWIFDLVVMGPIAPALAIPLWVAFRRRVIEPRLGHVRFDSSRRRRLKRAHVVSVISACILAQILSFLDLRLTLDETCPVNAYTKSDYTGRAVDQSRVTMAPNTLSTSQMNLVAARFRSIRERFYG